MTAWAVFLDVDGTLVEIADEPDRVHVPDTLGPRLTGLENQLGGALALVSGRTIADVDRLFAPYHFSIGGVHGAEVRMDGTVHRIDVDRAALDPVRQAFAGFVAGHPGTRWEDKGFAVAVHYRQNPAAGTAAVALARHWGETLGETFHVLAGKMVAEVRFRCATKAAAVRSLMADPPFADRTPVYLGDDRTDEDAFAWVNDHRGISIVVGSPPGSCATHTLDRVADVHKWLDALAQHLQALS